jgi:hypothetical protein
MILPKRGRPAVVIMMELERELTSEDIFRFATMNAHPFTARPAIQRLREVHHRVARLLASGMTIAEVAIRTGRSEGRVSDLQQDPAFKELIHYYTSQIEEVEITDAQRAREDYSDINDLVREEIMRRLEDPSKINEIPVDELRRLMTDTGDRTHSPPKTAVPSINIPARITFNMGVRDIRPKEPITIEGESSTVVETESEDNG